MGFFGLSFGSRQAGPPVVSGHGSSRPWVMAIEGAVIQVFSLVVSCASALAIAQVYAPPGSPVVRIVQGYALAVMFAGTGFFMTRSIAYRLMLKEGIFLYLPLIALVELVEVYCNYVEGVHDLHLADLLQGIPMGQHGFLTTVGCVVVSCIPAMVIAFAVLEMDLLKRRLSTGTSQPKAVPASQGYVNPSFPTAVTQPQRPVRHQPPVSYAQPAARGGAASNGANPPPPGVMVGP